MRSIQIGNDQFELEHQVQGERTYGGTWEGLNGRMEADFLRADLCPS
ncbi:hypothetical protein PAECIP111891_00433 [Paenibacillus allorhizoplanae]|uniref:Uncharacterized protein n=1 Tax=Paenibacillus allorhizoplanae TaxID=2905648 RepID=A0ABN8FV06_9BACL|nr:hypothetical protein [Paenibacillus allorhizoplanae]CAH1192748.1 hypothetical protein PAECIP111891_00433 [Paenibacillus allorhizoplanae]